MRRFALAGACVCCLGCGRFVDVDGLTGGQGSTACPPPALFCADFEDGKGAFDDYDGNPDGQNDVIDDPGPFGSSENRVMQLTLPSADLTKAFGAEYATLHVRFQAKWLRDVGLRAGLYAGGRDVVGSDNVRPAGDEWFAALIHGRLAFDEILIGAWYVGMYQSCPGSGPCEPDRFPCTADPAVCSNPAHRGDSEPEVTDDRWYCLELSLSAGAPSTTGANTGGSVSFAIDGVRFGPFVGLWFRTTAALGIDAFWLAPTSINDGPALLIDDLVISETEIGCP